MTKPTSNLMRLLNKKMNQSDKYQTTWLQSEIEIPPEGAKCPKCSNGTLKKSQYWEGVYCPSCKWKFRLSDWNKAVDKDDIQIVEEPDARQETEVMKRLDLLSEFFKYTNHFEKGLFWQNLEKEIKAILNLKD